MGLACLILSRSSHHQNPYSRVVSKDIHRLRPCMAVRNKVQRILKPFEGPGALSGRESTGTSDVHSINDCGIAPQNVVCMFSIQTLEPHFRPWLGPGSDIDMIQQ